MVWHFFLGVSYRAFLGVGGPRRGVRQTGPVGLAGFGLLALAGGWLSADLLLRISVGFGLISLGWLWLGFGWILGGFHLLGFWLRLDLDGFRLALISAGLGLAWARLGLDFAPSRTFTRIFFYSSLS